MLWIIEKLPPDQTPQDTEPDLSVVSVIAVDEDPLYPV